MVTLIPTNGEGGRRRREAGPAIAISLVVHAVFFIAVGLVVPRPQFTQVDQPPVLVTLLPSFEHARSQAPRAETGKSPTSGRAAPDVFVPHVHVPRTAAADAPSSPIAAPSPAEAAPGKPGTSTAPGPLPYDESERGVRAFLRGTVGCESADAVHLTAEERARCNERFAQDARGAQPFSGIDPDKRGAYSVQAAADERKRAAREGMGASPIVSCSGVGSNMGVGCLPDSAMGRVRIP